MRPDKWQKTLHVNAYCPMEVTRRAMWCCGSLVLRWVVWVGYYSRILLDTLDTNQVRNLDTEFLTTDLFITMTAARIMVDL